MKAKGFPVSFLLLTCLLCLGALLLLSSCASKTATEPVQPGFKLAVIDMNKALQSHPKNQERMALEKELNTLLANQQVLAEQVAQTAADEPVSNPAPLDMAKGPNQQQQQYQAKMSAKHAELNALLNEKYAALRKQSSDEYDAFSDALDKEYQPSLFDLQLKLKTLQLSKEEGQALQDKIEKLHQEKNDRLAARQQQLSTALTAKVAEQQQQLAAEMERYGQQVTKELAVSPAAPMPEDMSVQPVDNTAEPVHESLAEQNAPSPDELAAINRLKAKISALETFMIQDIENDCGKIALAKGYEIVVTNVTANITADDITAEVISQFSK